MCGIAGFVSLDGPRPAWWLDRLGRRLVGAMHHRGPDDSGLHLSDDGRVLLAATRLAVRDRSPSGHQPMVSPDGEVALAYNGELYASRTRISGWPARSRCDTEQFLQAVHAGPPTVVGELDGMFAAAWYDRRTGRTVLARDHFGVKPLVWCRVAGGILFASEVATLLASGLVEPRVDWTAFLHRAYVRMDAIDDGTWLAGIHSVEPGHLMVIDGDRVSHRRYWMPAPAEREVTVDEVAEAFRRAVDIRRPADVPMAAVVSGGVDSSAVFGALRAMDSDVTPYVVRYEGTEAGQNEDLPYALEVARAAGVEPVHCDVAVADVEGLTAVAVRHLQRPFLHGAELALLRTYQRIAADGRVVVFSGHGSDELWGYQEGTYFPIVDPTRPPDTHGEHYLRTRLYRDERPLWHRMVDELCRHVGVSEEDVTDRVWSRTLRPYRELATLDPHKRGRYHLMRRFLVYVNEMVDACSSAYSLEDRPVFQDVTLAGLAFSMPEWRKNRGGLGGSKPFLKQALAPYLPPSVLHRPKKGFPAPRDTAFLARLRGLVESVGLPADAPLSGELLAAAGTGELLFLYSSQMWLRQLPRADGGPTHGSGDHDVATPDVGLGGGTGPVATVAGS